MKTNSSNLVNWILIFFILLIPINNSYEVVAMLRGQLEWGGWSRALTPIWLKIYKDVFILMLLFMLLFKISQNWRVLLSIVGNKRLFPLHIFLVHVVLTSLASLLVLDIEYVGAGFRAYWTLLIVYVGFVYYDFDEKTVFKFVYYFMIFQLCFQFYQYFFDLGEPVFGERRSPGFFIVPTTAGAFSLLSYYFSSRFNSKALKIISILSLFLSTSSIGILIMFGYTSYLLVVNKRLSIFRFLIIIPIIVYSLMYVFDNIGFITGRETGALISLDTRLGYVTEIFGNFENLIWGAGMGLATSQAVISGLNGAVVADNTFAGSLLNIGWLGTALLIWFVISSYWIFDHKLLFFVFLFYAMVSNMFEMTPVIQILMFLLGAQISKKTTGFVK